MPSDSGPRTIARAPARKRPPAERVSIRMYRGLLGDCFLLTHKLGKRSYSALIDCGALQCIGAKGKKPKTAQAVEHLKAVVEDLARHTGRKLDLVVATHAHYDHLSGFLLHFDAWRAFEIAEVWMAWTEDPEDELAKAINENWRKALGVLKASVDPAFGLEAESAERIHDLLQFYGHIDAWPLAEGSALAPQADGKKNPRSCADILRWLAASGGTGRKVRYLKPGQAVAFGVDERVSAKVLGPPRSGARLLQMDPSGGDGREVYLASADLVEAVAVSLVAAGRAGAPRAHALAHDAPAGEASMTGPFGEAFNRTWADVAEDDPLRLAYEREKTHQISRDFAENAELLAMKIDGDVNNTSLALALELPTRQVLLFPADAQVGNWLSWHDQRYPADPKDPASGASVADLLERVVLYKVGHHGSHNATAKEKGLELMTSLDLVALIPVVSDIAHEQKTKNNPAGWAMPYDDLLARLKERTRGRIVTGDGNVADERSRFARSIFQLSYDAANPRDPLWAELTLELSAARPAN